MQKRPFLIILMACVAFTAVSVGAFVFTHLEHEHTGSDCPICLQIEIAQNLLKGLGLASLVMFFAGFGAAAKLIFAKTDFSCFCFLSLIALKTRYNS
jgi:hypothetical protein